MVEGGGHVTYTVIFKSELLGILKNIIIILFWCGAD